MELESLKMEEVNMDNEVTGREEVENVVKLDSLVINEEGGTEETINTSGCNGIIQNENENLILAFYECLIMKDKYGVESLMLLANDLNFNVNHAFVESFIELPYKSWTALHFVCKKDQTALLSSLLELGADPCLENSKGENALHVACKYGHYSCVQILLSHCPVLKDKQNIQGLTPLMKAIYRSDTSFRERNYEKTIDALISAGCDVNLSPPSDMSPLHVAAGKWRSTELVKKLISAGADVNIATQQQQKSSPLMTALCRQKVNTETVITLIDAGADVNYKNPYGKSLLHVAVAKSEDICVEHLLQAGADPNQLDAEGDSPLWIAVCENNVKIAPMLIKYGANVNFTNRDYHMSLLCRAASDSNNKLMKLLLDNGADVNMTTRLGAPALHYVVDNVDREKLRMLLQRNCDLDDYSNFKDLYNPMNALQIAFSRDDEEMVKLLIMAGFPLVENEIQAKRLPRDIRENEELVEWIHHQFYNPKSLMHLCRLRLRNYYRTDILRMVKTLSNSSFIPRPVANYILMEDLLGGKGGKNVSRFHSFNNTCISD